MSQGCDYDMRGRTQGRQCPPSVSTTPTNPLQPSAIRGRPSVQHGSRRRTGEQNRVVSNRIVRLWPYVLIVISLIGLAYRLCSRPLKRLCRAVPMPCIDRGLTVTEKCSSLVWEPMYEMVLL